MTKVKWIKMYDCKGVGGSPRLSKSKWLKSDKTGLHTRHFYAFDYISGSDKESKNKPAYSIPQTLTEEKKKDWKFVKTDTERIVKELNEHCDYYEKHGHFEDDKPK